MNKVTFKLTGKRELLNLQRFLNSLHTNYNFNFFTDICNFIDNSGYALGVLNLVIEYELNTRDTYINIYIKHKKKYLYKYMVLTNE